VRARVLPGGPEVLPEDELEESEDDFDVLADEAPELEADEQLEAAPVSTGAFAAMEGEAPEEIETAPVAASDTQKTD